MLKSQRPLVFFFSSVFRITVLFVIVVAVVFFVCFAFFVISDLAFRSPGGSLHFKCMKTSFIKIFKSSTVRQSWKKYFNSSFDYSLSTHLI